MGAILAPVDIEDPSTTVLRKACELARAFGEPLTLLYVYALPTYASGEGTLVPFNLAKRIEAAARGALEDLRTGLRVDDLPIGLRVEPGGHPAETIARCASEERCRMIVMAASDRTAPGRDFLGRVTDRVLRLAPCPVLTMRR